MKTGLSLTALAAKIEQDINAKKDFIVEGRNCYVNEDATSLLIENQGLDSFEIAPTAHQQLAATLQIPDRFYKKLQTEAPDLLATNINRLFQQRRNQVNMLRTINGQARAFLGSGYEIIDNEQVLGRLLPHFQTLAGDIEILSTNVTETKMYIKIAFPKVEGEVRRGDIIRHGLTITNSEIGIGGLNVYLANYRLICTNGMTRMTLADRRQIRHLGSKRAAGEILNLDRAKAKLDKFVEHVQRLSNSEHIERTIRNMQRTTKLHIEVDPETLMERAKKHFGLTHEEQVKALNHLYLENDLTAYGFLNSLTRTAQDAERYDRASELEAIGAKVLTLSEREWKELAYA